MASEVRWDLVKRWIELSVDSWRIQLNKKDVTTGDVVEWLFQKGFIKGGKWKEFVSGIPDSWIETVQHNIREPLREGYFPPNMYIAG